MNNVYVVGSYGIPVGKWTEKSHRDIVRDAYLGALKDSGLDKDCIGSLWSGCSMLHSWKQYCIIGQIMTVPLVNEGLLPERVAINNVENACATGSSAFQAAVLDVASGFHDVSVAIGFEKLNIPGNKALTISQIHEGADRLHAAETEAAERQLAIDAGVDPDSIGSPDRSHAMDLYFLYSITFSQPHSAMALAVF